MHTVAKQQFHIKSISSCDKVSDAENLLLCVTCTKGQQLYKHYPKKYLNQCGIQKLVYKTQLHSYWFNGFDTSHTSTPNTFLYLN